MIKFCMHTSSTISIGAVHTGHRQGQVSGLIYTVQSQKDGQHKKNTTTIDYFRIFCTLQRRILQTITFLNKYFLIVTCPFV